MTMPATHSMRRPACPVDHLTHMPLELLSVRDDLVWLCSTHATDAPPLGETLRQLATKLHRLAEALSGAYDQGPVMQQVVHACATAFGCTPSQILGRSRPGYVTNARHSAVRLYSILAMTSSVQTAAAFGGRDHGAALNSYRRCHEFLQTDPEFRRRYLAAAAALGLSPESALVPPTTHTPNPKPQTPK